MTSWLNPAALGPYAPPPTAGSEVSTTPVLVTLGAFALLGMALSKASDVAADREEQERVRAWNAPEAKAARAKKFAEDQAKFERAQRYEGLSRKAYREAKLAHADLRDAQQARLDAWLDKRDLAEE